jgi:hypothetical protein
MKKRPFLAVSLILVSLASTSQSGIGMNSKAPEQDVSVKTKRPTASLIRATEEPQILEFKARPDKVVAREESMLSWKIVPGIDGSPIESLEIRSGTPSAPVGLIYRIPRLEGTSTSGPVDVLGRGVGYYFIKVTDRAGRSSTRTLEIGTESMESFLAGLSGLTFEVQTVVEPGHRSHVATLGLESASRATAQNLMICVYQAYAPILLDFNIPDGVLIGNYNGAKLVPGHNEFRIGLSPRPLSVDDDRRGLNKVVLIVAREYRPGVFDKILVKALYELIETRDSLGPLYSVRLIQAW